MIKKMTVLHQRLRFNRCKNYSSNFIHTIADWKIINLNNLYFTLFHINCKTNKYLDIANQQSFVYYHKMFIAFEMLPMFLVECQSFTIQFMKYNQNFEI